MTEDDFVSGAGFDPQSLSTEVLAAVAAHFQKCAFAPDRPEPPGTARNAAPHGACFHFGPWPRLVAVFVGVRAGAKETLNKGEFVRILIWAGRTGDGEAEKGDCEPRWAGLSQVDGGVGLPFFPVSTDWRTFFMPSPSSVRRSARWPGQRACRVDARSWPGRDTSLSDGRTGSSRCGRDVPRTLAPRL